MDSPSSSEEEGEDERCDLDPDQSKKRGRHRDRIRDSDGDVEEREYRDPFSSSDEDDDDEDAKLGGIRIKTLTVDHSETVAIASFESLGVPVSKKFKNAKSEIFSIKDGFLTPDEQDRMKHILAMDIPLENGKSFRYEGSTPYDEDDVCDTWAAVVDTETGNATLYPTEVFHMMPCSSGYGDHPWRLRMDMVKPEDANSIEDAEAVSAIATVPELDDENAKRTNKATELGVKSNHLSASFGTAVKQRRNKNRGENRIVKTSTDAGGREITEIVKNTPSVLIKKEDGGIVPGDIFGILPPINVSQSSPKDVYCMDDILPREIADLLLSITDVKAIIQRDEAQFESWSQLNVFPTFLLKSLKTLSLDEDRREMQAKYLYFAYILVSLFNAKFDQMRKKSAGLPETWPKKIYNHLFRTYTQENITGDGKRRTRVMPQVLKDKALIHAILVLVITNDFSFAANDFLADLRQVPEAKIQSLCNLARLTFFKRLNVEWIELRTPLPEYKDPSVDPSGSRKRRK